MESNFQSVGNTALVFSGTAQSSLEVPSSVPLGMLRTGQITIREAINLFMQSYAGRDTSRGQRMQWWSVKLGHLTLAEVDEDHIFFALEELQTQKSRFYAGKDADGRDIHKAKGKTLSPATINRYSASIGGLFTWCIKKRLTPKGYENPCKGIESRPENNEVVRFLSESERTALLNACRASTWDKLYLLVMVALTTGARRGELLRLTWGDIDFERQIASVHQTKNGDKKNLPLIPSVIDELNKFKTSNPQELVFASKRRPDSAFSFVDIWYKTLKMANIKNFRFHDLRHTCASMLAQNGCTLLEIGEVLGHRQLNVTKRYSHLCSDHKTKLINRVLGEIR
ncbi:tyrosine-type recombinase/integrase [Polynucleobacter sinensis]|uniref:tyrosine-type recombinase/integrase n=1 Tax=Polynucleobacter sinensis TaxID=1743157 RepID=UPI00078340E2|nr:site-specific integrase [Polynucleobacter sinensis]